MNRFIIITTCLFGLALATPCVADEIELVGGDVLVGTIVETTEDGDIVMDHPTLGLITIPADQIKPPDPPNPGLFGTSFLEGWTRQISAGLSGASGNTENLNANVRMHLKGESDRHRQTWLSQYYYSADEDDATTNRFFTMYEHDLLFADSRWFLFGQGRYDYDEFKAWDHRLAAALGVGYEFFNNEVFELRGRGGVGVSQTLGGEEETRPEGVLGLDTVWNITEHQQFTARSTYYPDLSDISEYRIQSLAAWNVAFPELAGFGLSFGVQHDYESDTDADSGHDVLYSANLSYDF